MNEFELQNPFDELPDRDDVNYFDKKKVNDIIQNVSEKNEDMNKGCKDLKKLMENPLTIQYLHSLPEITLVDLLSSIIEEL